MTGLGFLGLVVGARGRSRARVGAPMNPIGAPNTRGRTPGAPTPRSKPPTARACALARAGPLSGQLLLGGGAWL